MRVLFIYTWVNPKQPTNDTTLLDMIKNKGAQNAMPSIPLISQRVIPVG